jgi:hypothetical protein
LNEFASVVFGLWADTAADYRKDMTMSAPETNIETQKKKHKGPLVGIVGAVIFAAVLFVALLAYVSDQGGTPEGADVQIDGRTGAEVPAGN